MKSTLVALGLFCALMQSLAGSALAAEIKGIRMADTMKAGGKTLVLNGLGLRQATILNINVYAAALYLESKSQDADAILASNGPKNLEMVFMRDVEAKDVSKAWTEGFEKNCETNCEALKPSLEKLKASMNMDMKKGDVMAISFLPEKVELLLKGKVAGSVESREFSKTLLRIWLGKNPPNDSLKEGLLGKSS